VLVKGKNWEVTENSYKDGRIKGKILLLNPALARIRIRRRIKGDSRD
jgi:hypothetical protein